MARRARTPPAAGRGRDRDGHSIPPRAPAAEKDTGQGRRDEAAEGDGGKAAACKGATPSRRPPHMPSTSDKTIERRSHAVPAAAAAGRARGAARASLVVRTNLRACADRAWDEEVKARVRCGKATRHLSTSGQIVRVVKEWSHREGSRDKTRRG